MNLKEVVLGVFIGNILTGIAVGLIYVLITYATTGIWIFIGSALLTIFILAVIAKTMEERLGKPPER